ncbi:MAG TPA: hypothetical protein VK750_09425 [Cytophagaceae bacterium]|nr:hypothetical protein [Cytophagaceae bacterium]
MNGVSNLHTRLLKLYPVKTLKDHFDLPGKSSEVIEGILNQFKAKDIHEFSALNIDYTRQHVYIFNIEKSFKASSFNTTNFPLRVIQQTNTTSDYSIVCLPEIEFKISVIRPFEERILKFYQPLKISVINSHLIVQITTLEKNLSDHCEVGKKVVETTRVNDENYLLDSIKSVFINQGYNITKCDLHKGIKKLWDDNIIDSKYLKTKNSKSTNTVAMDENYTVREVYPQEYNQIKNNPILKTLFRYKGKNVDYFCDSFSIDPSQGHLSVTSFPESVHQIKNIINEILKNNK